MNKLQALMAKEVLREKRLEMLSEAESCREDLAIFEAERCEAIASACKAASEFISDNWDLIDDKEQREKAKGSSP